MEFRVNEVEVIVAPKFILEPVPPALPTEPAPPVPPLPPSQLPPLQLYLPDTTGLLIFPLLPCPPRPPSPPRPPLPPRPPVMVNEVSFMVVVLE